MAKRKRLAAEPISNILAELIARRGFSRLRTQEHVQDAWKSAVGEPGSRYTRVGPLRRGVLEVLVANSVLLQELAGFHKQELLRKLQAALGMAEIRDLRFRLDETA